MLLFGRAVTNRLSLHPNSEPNWERQRGQADANQTITICYLQDILENVMGCVAKVGFYYWTDLSSQAGSPGESWTFVGGGACPCEIYASEEQEQTSFPARGRKQLSSVYPAPPQGCSGLNSRLWRTEACKRGCKFLEKIILVEVWRVRKKCFYNPPQPTQPRVNLPSVASRHLEY